MLGTFPLAIAGFWQFDHRGSAKFAAPDYKGFVEQPALLQVFEKGADRLVGSVGQEGNAWGQRIPPAWTRDDASVPCPPCFSPLAIVAVFSNSLFWTMTMISVSIFFWILWSITVHSLPGDYFPPRAVGSAYGIAGTGSTVGSMISTWAVGAVLDATKSYVPVFIGLSLLMPIGLVLGFFLMRRVEPIRDFDLTEKAP